ncbi:MAG: hypothetical protein AAGB30_11130 [Pedobacter sp.]|nr:hypothetical protein [Cellulomonas sp.]
MGNDELLAKAISDYPKGSVFIQMHSGEDIVSSGIFYIGSLPTGKFVADAENKHMVYCLGRWAAISSLKERLEDQP